MKIFCLFLFFFTNISFACDTKRNELECVTVVNEALLAAQFPLIKKREQWNWYTKLGDATTPEYAWIGEPGNCVKGQFVSDGIAFAASIRTLNVNTKPVSGSLKELLKVAEYGNAYYTKKVTREERGNLVTSTKLRTRVMNDEVGLLSLDRFTINKLFGKHPTHIKMQAILPYENESYTCVTEVVYE